MIFPRPGQVRSGNELRSGLVEPGWLEIGRPQFGSFHLRAGLGIADTARLSRLHVILVAPLAAMLAVLLTEPLAVAPAYTGLFMDKLATFVKLYFPVFLLGAVFGKLIEVSGAASSIASRISQSLGANHAIFADPVIRARPPFQILSCTNAGNTAGEDGREPDPRTNA